MNISLSVPKKIHPWGVVPENSKSLHPGLDKLFINELNQCFDRDGNFIFEIGQAKRTPKFEMIKGIFNQFTF